METINQKRLLIICPFALPNLGGVESHIAKLMRYAAKNNYFSTLLTYIPLTRNVKAPYYEVDKDSEIIRVNWFGVGYFTKLEPYFLLVFLYLTPGLLFQTLKYYIFHSGNFNVVHAHGLVSAFIVRVLNIFWRKRTIVSTHAVYDFKNKVFLAFLVKNILIGFDKIWLYQMSPKLNWSI